MLPVSTAELLPLVDARTALALHRRPTTHTHSLPAGWRDSVHLEQLPGSWVPSWPGTPRDIEEKEAPERSRGIAGYTGRSRRPPLPHACCCSAVPRAPSSGSTVQASRGEAAALALPGEAEARQQGDGVRCEQGCATLGGDELRLQAAPGAPRDEGLPSRSPCEAQPVQHAAHSGLSWAWQPSGPVLPYSMADTRYASYGGVRNNATSV
jgi:hypothetical protein